MLRAPEFSLCHGSIIAISTVWAMHLPMALSVYTSTIVPRSSLPQTNSTYDSPSQELFWFDSQALRVHHFSSLRLCIRAKMSHRGGLSYWAEEQGVSSQAFRKIYNGESIRRIFICVYRPHKNERDGLCSKVLANEACDCLQNEPWRHSGKLYFFFFISSKSTDIFL